MESAFTSKRTFRSVVKSDERTVYLTVQAYAAHWQRLICYCFRALPHGIGIRGGKGEFRFTREQEKLEIKLFYAKFEQETPEGACHSRRRLLRTCMRFI